jgi:hypothetical protein
MRKALVTQAQVKKIIFFNLLFIFFASSCEQHQFEKGADSIKVMKPNPEEYLCKTVIIGVSLYDPLAHWLRQTEIHGCIAEVSPKTGMSLVLLDSGRQFHVSPDLNALQKAAPGLYRSHTTGKEIKDPDFISLWKVTLAPQSKRDNFEWGTGARWERGADIKFPK